MSNTQTIPATASDPSVAAGAAQFLSPVVQGLQALVLNAKQAHWHVRGSNFVGVHELFDQIVGNASASADTAAERIVALGLPVDARAKTVADKVAATEVPAGFASSESLIRAIIADIDRILVDLQTAIEGLDDIDLTSQDIAIEIRRGLEKDRWFLFSHVAP